MARSQLGIYNMCREGDWKREIYSFHSNTALESNHRPLLTPALYQPRSVRVRRPTYTTVTNQFQLRILMMRTAGAACSYMIWLQRRRRAKLPHGFQSTSHLGFIHYKPHRFTALMIRALPFPWEPYHSPTQHYENRLAHQVLFFPTDIE